MDTMTLIVGLGCLIALLFGGVLLFGAPYLPTLRPQIDAAFELLGLKPGQTLLELGCGDGKVLVAAAEAGFEAVGIELNPVLAGLAWLRTRKYKGKVRVLWGNFWSCKWPESDGVFVFLLDRFMARLGERMAAYGGPVASVAFKIPDKKPAQEKDGVFLYDY